MKVNFKLYLDDIGEFRVRIMVMILLLRLVRYFDLSVDTCHCSDLLRDVRLKIKRITKKKPKITEILLVQ